MRWRVLLAGLLLPMAASCFFAEDPAAEQADASVADQAEEHKQSDGENADQPVAIEVEYLDRGPIPHIGPVGEIGEIPGEFQYTEGPTWGPGGLLYFADVPTDRIYRFDTETKHLEVFVEPSFGGIGLMYAGGRLYACTMEGGLVAYDSQGDRIILAAEYQGEPLNAPNDLVVDSTGGVYFSDPRLPREFPSDQQIQGVYYWTARTAQKTLMRIIRDLGEKAPNGVILSPDEKTLYVVCTYQDEIMRYPVLSPGDIGEAAVLARIRQPEGVTESGGNGVAMDSRGNLYVCTEVGVQVFSSEGDFLGVISLPERPSNAVFGGPDLKTLYVAARTSVYVVPMAVAGHAFPGSQTKALKFPGTETKRRKTVSQDR